MVAILAFNVLLGLYLEVLCNDGEHIFQNMAR